MELELELIIAIIALSILMLVWFKLVMLFAKMTVGKQATMWQIILFLVIAGPVGWAVILIIFVYNQVDKHWTKIFK
jgi:hypothetical protein